MDEVRDRYGMPPESVLNLAEYASIRLMADRIGLESVDREAQTVVLKFRPDAKLDPQWLFRVVQERGDVVLVPPGDAEARPSSSDSHAVPSLVSCHRGGQRGPTWPLPGPGGRRGPGPER